MLIKSVKHTLQLPKQSNIGSTEVTIEGAYPMVTFKLGRNL